MKKTRTPIECNSLASICKIPRDSIDLPKDFWMITDGKTITIAKQELGKNPEQIISIPKSIFDSCVRWYLTGKKNGKIEL